MKLKTEYSSQSMETQANAVEAIVNTIVPAERGYFIAGIFRMGVLTKHKAGCDINEINVIESIEELARAFNRI